MIEHRWVTTEGSTEPPKLQWRPRPPHNKPLVKWQDVPTVVLPADPDESELLREAREIVANQLREAGLPTDADYAIAGLYPELGHTDIAVRAVMAALRRGRGAAR